MPNKLSPHGKTIVAGTIVQGSYTPDLLKAFADELKAIKPFGERELIAEALDYAKDWDKGHPGNNQAALECLEDLKRVLESAAPAGLYFGTLKGASQDWGFWRR